MKDEVEIYHSTEIRCIYCNKKLSSFTETHYCPFKPKKKKNAG